MQPAVSTAWRRVLRALARVKAPLKSHEKNQRAAAIVAAALEKTRRRQ